ncbi:MAG: TetR/AcrR family transcriptional regulator [Lachnospiraceae bacterium]|nr:TetR/AcrR family transcriptional regulator [Lachnospiraceae bacterium]
MGKVAAMIAKAGKAEENKKKKREALLHTAFDLFTSQGFSKTTVANIAEKAGVAKGTFYLYFKDKYDLRDKLIRHEANEILQRSFTALQATGLRTFEEKMLFMTGNIISQLTENKLVLKFISRNLSWGMLKHDVSDLTPFDGEDLDVEQIYIQELRKSNVRYRNPEIMLYMIVDFVGSTAYSSIIESDPLPIDEMRPYILDAVQAIMKSQEVTPQDSQ